MAGPAAVIKYPLIRVVVMDGYAVVHAWLQRMQASRAAVDLRPGVEKVWSGVRLSAASMSYAPGL